MKKQLTLTGLLLVASVTGAYLAGRLPLLKRLRIAEHTAVESEIKFAAIAKDFDTTTAFWQQLAYASRNDLANAKQDLRIHHAPKGTGFSLNYYPEEPPDIPQEYYRWKFQLSGDIEEYAKQLDTFGIKLFASYSGPPRTIVVDQLSSEKHVSKLDDQLPRRSTIYRPQFQDFDIIETLNIPSEPELIVKIVPPELSAVLRQKEMEHAQNRQIDFHEIRKTTFVASTTANGFKLTVSEIETRSTR